ncbi:hypothetical protein B0T25DRAFT_134274 [Lasiosphaeria hispida]|uniref:Uncharacterized protein n=1 Tax=Lasiosphaeria hispida TaxID=260671 RepID=A0AAJ0HK94_9PEZI|nr:hypothetical protein B0T25DRAFT_134274 [Lasiosphaeria hispida]
MTTYNPNISNGTCYYAENTKTNGDFIPCGNNAIQTWPCCKAGSFCLALGDANACWDANSGNTYVAGCTDPSFGSPDCLHKPPPFHDQEWVAINQACKNLNSDSASTNVTNWTGCVVDNNSTKLVKLPMASCTPYCKPSNVLYAGISSLPAYASLPTLAGSSIFWQNNFVPPTAPIAGYTPGIPIGIVGTGAPTGGGGSSSSPSGGLSTGAKAGIGVGAALGGLLLITMIVTLFIWCRKHRNNQLPHDPHMPPPAGHPDNQPYPPSPPPPHPYSTYHQHQHGMAPPPAEFASPHSHTPVAAYTGYKTELPADERFPSPSNMKHPSPGQEYVEMDNNNDNIIPRDYLTPQTAATGAVHTQSPGSPPLSAASTMLAASPPSAQAHLAGAGGGVYHTRSTSSPSYSQRVAAQQLQHQQEGGPEAHHSRSVSSSGVSPGYSTITTEGGHGWEAGSYR